MKKLFFVVLFCLICSVGYAKPSLSSVLSWKFPDAVFMTGQADPNDGSENPKMVIRDWKSSSPKPTAEEIEVYTQEYIAFLAQEKIERRARKRALMTKLGLTKSDFKAMIELLDDRNDD